MSGQLTTIRSNAMWTNTPNFVSGVEKPHPNGYIIAIKKNNSGYSFEEYGQ